MILTETLNDWAEVWASLTARSLVDASLVLVIVGIVWLGFRRRMSPQLGYCLFLLVPAKLLIPIEIPVPGWVTHASPGHTAERIVARTTVSPAGQVSPDFVRWRSYQPGVGADGPGHRFDLPQPSGEETGYLEGSTRSPSSSVAAALSDVALHPAPATEEPSPVPSTRAKLMIAWSAIVLGMIAYFLYTQWRFLGILRRAESVEPRTLPVDFGHLKRLAGVRRSIRLLASPVVSTPAVHGLVRPSLLLPPDFVESVSPAQMRFVLLHELAHVGRRDLWVATFQRLVQMVYFFNPAVWIANWLIDRQREYACDDAALATGGVSRRESGEAFVRIVERANSRKPSLDPALGIFNPKHFFRRRLMRILDTDRRIRPKLTFGSAVLLVAMATILLPHVRAIEERIDDNGPAVTKADTPTDAGKTEKEPADAGPSEPRGPLVSAFGRVADSDGKPMPGVAVHLLDWLEDRVDQDPMGRRRPDVLATTRTDEEGNFRFDNVPVSPFHPSTVSDMPCDVVAVAEGYAVAWEHLAVATNRTPLNLTLIPESHVSGRIVDKQKQPIEGALVEVLGVTPLGFNRTERHMAGHLSLYRSRLAPTAKSDADGRVSIGQLPPDKRIILALDHDDYRNVYFHVATTDTAQPDVVFSRRYENTKTRQKVHSHNFTLTMEPRGPRLSGRITLADSGAPSARATVLLHGARNRLTEETDEDGRYVFKDTMRPEYRMTVFAPEDTDYLGRQLPLTLPEDGSHMQLDLELPIGQIVTGSVVDEDTDEGVPGVLVTNAPIRGKEPSEYCASRGLTDNEGNFRIAVPSGKSILQISGPAIAHDVPREGRPGERRDSRFVRMIEVTEVKTPADVRFWLTRGLVINGSVTDAAGQPVDGAKVRGCGEFERKQTRTDEEGRFTLAGFPVDSKQGLEVTHVGRELYGKTLIDADSNAISLRIVSVDIQLAAAAVVKGRVLADGEPVGSVHIDLRRRKSFGSTRPLGRAYTDTSGEFVFHMVPPGEELHTSNSDGRFTGLHSGFFVPEPGQVYRLPPFERKRRDMEVSGLVVDARGSPLEGVRVTVGWQEGVASPNPFNNPFYGGTPTGKDGRFKITHVPKGPLSLSAYRRDPSSATPNSYLSAQVEAQAGRDDVRIVMSTKP